MTDYSGRKPKLIAFDLDGTLAESKQPLAPDMAEVITRLLETMPMAVMSGAGISQFKNQFASRLPQDEHLENLYLFPANASQCFIYREGAWQATYDFSYTKAEVDHVTNVLTETLKEVGLGEPPTPIWGERIENRGGAQISFSPLGQQAPLSEKIAWRDAHNDIRVRLHGLLVPKLPEFSVVMGGTTTIDITRKGITKAYGVGELAKLSGIQISDMLYVGDALGPGGNDAVVIPTGIPTYQAYSPEDTAKLIEEILKK